jgi:WD40 repeat protein
MDDSQSPGGQEYVRSAEFDPSSRRFLTTSSKGWVRVWRYGEAAPTKLAELQLPAGPRWPTAAAVGSFSRDGRHIVVGGSDHIGRVYDLAAGVAGLKLEERAQLRGQVGEIESATFSADGDWLVTGSLDKTARVWEAATGRSAAELRGHTDVAAGVSFKSGGPGKDQVVTWSWGTTACGRGIGGRPKLS